MLRRIRILRQITMLSLIVVASAAACTSPSPTPFISPAGTVPVSPLVPTSNPTLQFPTPQSGKGAVIGRLVAGSPTGSPFIAGDLYLGVLIPGSSPEAQPMVSFTQGTDPGVATYDKEGRFAFTNIATGTYALVNWTPVSSFVIEAPTGGLVKVVVEAGKTTDLGTVVVP